ncbi:hypothetical protein L1I30_00075 [Gillisia sp. M10.2A]|uniref:Uncharacterized protein n=1 Tax=Gillisia lutea TaxID=2909668 RepID=A0ABS9EDT5_9FLAO|nr:hypothetical protein [Gillisia lutea]MCF4100049.1 hypothetical protein [Gillisia lutea]
MNKNLIRKAVIIYQLIVIIICLIFNSLEIYESNYDIKLLIISEILLLLGLYYVIKTGLELNHYKGNLFPFVFNIMQSLAIAFMGFIYKISYGPQIYIRLSNYGDWTMESSFRLYSREFHLNVTPPDGLFYLGINIIQICFAVYFFKLLKTEYGYIFPTNNFQKKSNKKIIS